MKKKHIIIAGSSLIGVLIILIAIIAAMNVQSEPTYLERIESGQRYITSGNYEKAVLEYKAAIDLDETREEGYVGLSTAYRGQDMMNLAYNTLQTGLVMSSSTGQIETDLELYFSDRTSGNENSDSNDDVTIMKIENLRFFSTATYKNYKKKYPDLEIQTKDGECIARTSEMDADIIFSDRGSKKSINPSSQRPYDESQPTMIVLRDPLLLFSEDVVVTYESLSNMPFVSELSQLENQVIFLAYGCNLSVICDETGALNAASSITIYPVEDVEKEEKEIMQTIKGTVTDKTAGKTLYDVKLSFTPGVDERGEKKEITTDANGNYSVEVKETGVYTVSATKEGYKTESFQIYVAGVEDQSINDFELTPERRKQTIFIEFKDGARSHTDERRDMLNIMYAIGTSGSDRDYWAVHGSGDVYLMFAAWELKDESGEVLGTSEDLNWRWNLNIVGPVKWKGSFEYDSPDVYYRIIRSFSRSDCSLSIIRGNRVYVFDQEMKSAGLAEEYYGEVGLPTFSTVELEFEYEGKMWTIDLTNEEILYDDPEGSGESLGWCSAFGVATSKQSEEIEINLAS